MSPAKSLDDERPISRLPVRRPACAAEVTVRIDALRQRSAAEVAALMDLSPALAELSVLRDAAWRPGVTATCG